jgi:transcriptional regulator with XRE-family HTH domain
MVWAMPTQATWRPGLKNTSVPINGAALRRARLARNWSQREVARRTAQAGIPVDNSNLAKAEKHGTSLGPRSLAVLLHVLPDLKPADLIPGLDDELQALLNAIRTENGIQDKAA